jgi:hypothetical protein
MVFRGQYPQRVEGFSFAFVDPRKTYIPLLSHFFTAR